MQFTTLNADLFYVLCNVSYFRLEETKHFRRVLKIAKSNY
jgi:hypothetical protein